MEKRSSRRHPIHALTACGHFTASTHGKIYDGKMLNYSSNGMCIESNAEFKKGAIVMIKVNALSSDADYQKLTEGSVTKKWVIRAFCCFRHSSKILKTRVIFTFKR